jgi:serine/threonine protein kinase
MGQERFETVDRLYRAALNVDPAHRSAFLAGACRGDESLRQAVELLLGLEHQTALTTQALPDLETGLYGTTNARRFSPSDIVGGRFEIVAFIGQGGMGDVYEAKDLHLGEHVALKTIRPELAADERMITQFKQEILVAKKVTHPNVCRIYDVGFHIDQTGLDDRSGTPSAKMFLTMELLRGEPLSFRLKGGPMAPSEALPIVEQMAAGLDAAHRVGVVHRDFKSANVVLVSASDGRTRAVITDFGLARHIRKDPLATVTLKQGNLIGTPDYMAPEQFTGGEITPAVDIYALGVVMFEMIARRRPFQADSAFVLFAQRLHQDPPSPRRYVPDLDRKWESAVLRCLEREPLKRFTSAREVVDAITGPEPPRIFPRTAVTRRRMLYAGLASAGVLSGSAALWRILRDPQPSIAILPLMSEDDVASNVARGSVQVQRNQPGAAGTRPHFECQVSSDRPRGSRGQQDVSRGRAYRRPHRRSPLGSAVRTPHLGDVRARGRHFERSAGQTATGVRTR